MAEDRIASRRRFRVLRGGLAESCRIGGVPVTVAPRGRPPFDVDAIALEDDTWGVLASDPEIREPTEPPARLRAAILEMEPEPPGSVVVRGGRPARLLAVVHDLAQEPTWCEPWVASALDVVFHEAARIGAGSLGLEPLGLVHGRLGARRFAEILRDTIGRHVSAADRIWLIASGGSRERLEAAIESVGAA